MQIRTWKNGDIMHPQSFTLTPPVSVLDWSNPLIEIRSAVKDVRDGSIYHPDGLTMDSVRLSDIVERGIWTQQEAGQVMDLFLRAYVGIGQPVAEGVEDGGTTD